MQAARADRPILILGAGINGVALARELALNAIPVVLVDRGDLAGGTTAYSSRLIHGGLRYLEYGELDLVRESLAERTRWLQLAPHLVRPLELSIPVGSRWSGLAAAAARFVGWRRWPATGAARPRGVCVVRAGLRMYDAYARDRSLPAHRVERVGLAGGLPVDPRRYRWLCTYFDGQLEFPERFVVELLADAQAAAAESGVPLEVFTYHEALRHGAIVEIGPAGRPGDVVRQLEPAAVVNATGAWVDETLAKLQVPSPRVIGGTKGSHIFTFHAGLRAALGGRGIYVEAPDGRPVFIAPLGECTLIGTTDERYEGDPGAAVATEAEIEYLLATVNAVLPAARLVRADVAFHCAGVRPLPYVPAGATAGITRRHWLQKHDAAPWPTYSVVGGKLTTCRSLAEAAARTILADLQQPLRGNSQQRPLPGAIDYPADATERGARIRVAAQQWGYAEDAATEAWRLWGSRAETVLAESGALDRTPLPDHPLTAGVVHWIVRHEHVGRLDDLVERRLMLLYHQRLTRRLLVALAERLVRAGRLAADAVPGEVARVESRLCEHFGRTVDAADAGVG